MPVMDIKPYYYEGHRPADVVEVVVWEENGDVKVVPEVVRIENAGQTVVWLAVNGEIESIEFQKNKDTPAPSKIEKRDRRIEARFPKKQHKGPHEYTFTFHTDGGKSLPADPIAVIEY